MLKKIFRRLNVILDGLKGVLLSLFIFISIALLICCVIHNVLKIGEISSYSGNYKKLVPVLDTKMMNIYVAARGGDKTIVILPDFGYESPVVQYKAVVDQLREQYTVVVVEYFGYGFSMGINEDRTNTKISSEVKTALTAAGIDGKYMLMPYGTSNIYAMNYAEMYPDDVQAIIAVDAVYPNEITEDYLINKYNDFKNNVVVNYVLEFTGIFRILSYIQTDFANIDKMQQNSHYGYDDIKVYRNRIGSSHLTGAMIKEIRTLRSNMEELKEHKYNSNMPVLNMLSSNAVTEYTQYKSDNVITKDLKQIVEELVTNTEIQQSVEITGNYPLELTNADEIVLQTQSFISSQVQ